MNERYRSYRKIFETPFWSEGNAFYWEMLFSTGSFRRCTNVRICWGALQFCALHAELEDSGKMTNRDCHDGILRENQIPVEMLRAILENQELSKNFQTNWKFYGVIPASP